MQAGKEVAACGYFDALRLAIEASVQLQVYLKVTLSQFGRLPWLSSRLKVCRPVQFDAKVRQSRYLAFWDTHSGSTTVFRPILPSLTVSFFLSLGNAFLMSAQILR